MRTLSRRAFLTDSATAAAGLAASSALAACTPAASPTPSPTAPAGTPGASGTTTPSLPVSPDVTGTTQILVGFGTGNAPEQIPPQEVIAADYEATRSGAMIDFLRIPDTDEAQRKLGVLIAAGDAPDIVLPTGLYGIALYLDQAVWLDVSDALAGSGASLDLFHEATHRAARAVNYYGPESTSVIGIPVGMFTHVVAYNKELFDRAGVPAPPHDASDDWTYARQLEVARALTVDRSGKTADQSGFDSENIVQFGLGHWDTGMMIRGYGGVPYDSNTRKMGLDTAAYIEGVQAGADLVNRHHVLATDQLAASVAAGADDAQLAAWRSGKVAMIDMCACDLLSFGVDNPFAWDVAQWPRGPERLVSHLNLDVGAIVAQSKRPQAAWDILHYMLVDPERAGTLSTQAYGAMAPLKSETGKFVASLGARFPTVDLQVFVDALPHSSPEQEEWFPAFTEVNDMGGQFLDAVYQGEASAAAQLPLFQAAAQQAVDNWFKDNTLPTS